MTLFDTRIIKGGALLDDTRLFLEAWDARRSANENVQHIRDSGTLGKRSRSRSTDVLAVLRRRFVDSGKGVATALRLLLDDPRAFREACYYEASRADPLLAAFASDALFPWYQAGRSTVTAGDVSAWLADANRTPAWTAPTRTRVAQGLLSALRDFGLLEGAVRKRIASPHLSLRSFSYVGLRERDAHPSSRALLEAPVWRRYLLDAERVRGLFREADRWRVLRFAEAGTAVRIDWLIRGLEEAPNVSA